MPDTINRDPRLPFSIPSMPIHPPKSRRGGFQFRAKSVRVFDVGDGPYVFAQVVETVPVNVVSLHEGISQTEYLPMK
jgi:hypothetical protein